MRPKPRTEDEFITDPPGSARESFGEAFERIVGLMARLRAEGGCPWDRAQTLASLRPYLVEEAYEVLEALEEGTVEDHREELGDLLLQVVFQAEIRREQGDFDAADVAHGIADKLVRRHPHVFGDETAQSPGAALERWEEMKSKEKSGRSVIGGVPKHLPSLLQAQRIGEKAANVGFDWETIDGPLEKLDEEIAEFRSAVASGTPSEMESEFGDVLFSMVNLARKTGIDAESALRGATARFAERFKYIESTVKARGDKLGETSLEEMERLWEEAKKKFTSLSTNDSGAHNLPPASNRKSDER